MKCHEWCEKVFWLESSLVKWNCPAIGQTVCGGGTSAAWGAPLWASSWARSVGNARSPTRSRWVASCPGVRRGSPRMESQVRRHLLAVLPCETPQVSTKLNWTLVSCNMWREPLQNLSIDDCVCCSRCRGSRGRAWARLGSSARVPVPPGEDCRQPEPQPGPLRSHSHWPAGARWLTATLALPQPENTLIFQLTAKMTFNMNE